MINDGYISLYRSLLESAFYKRSEYVHLWIHLLLKANHKDSKFLWNNQERIIKRGQLITGRKTLSKETGINESTIETILNLFETQHQIQQQKTNRFRCITIIKYEQFQNFNSSFNNQLTTNSQQNNTNNNNNNDNNKKEILKKKPETDSGESLSELFKKFWNAYPKKLNREYAFKKFTALKIDNEDLEVILTAIESQKVKGGILDPERIQFVPYASTYLNQKRWLDYYEQKGKEWEK